MEFNRPPYIISTDPARLDQEIIHSYLSSESYWARGRSLDTVRRAIEHSLCFGLYQGEKQAGFARVVTDYATFAWLCDVFVLEPYRGQGLGKWLVECVVSHPDLQAIPRLLLATRDAHKLYREYGEFAPLQAPERWMERVKRS
ncbi:MAG TPA: GNAT family N-acetyltransferase [Anaerolineales bacterium]